MLPSYAAIPTVPGGPVEFLSNQTRTHALAEETAEITVPADCDYMLVYFTTDGTPTISNVQWNGSAMATLINGPTHGCTNAFYGLANPDTGTHNVTWSLSVSGNSHFVVVYLKNVNSASPTLDTDSASGSNDHSSTMTSEDGGMCIIASCRTKDTGDVTAFTAAGGATLIHSGNHGTVSITDGICYEAAVGVSTTLGINANGTFSTAMIAVSFART